MSKITQVWWYSTFDVTCSTIGIVKVHDDKTNEDRFYIGHAPGVDANKDAEYIKDYGTPFLPNVIK